MGSSSSTASRSRTIPIGARPRGRALLCGVSPNSRFRPFGCNPKFGRPSGPPHGRRTRAGVAVLTVQRLTAVATAEDVMGQGLPPHGVMPRPSPRRCRSPSGLLKLSTAWAIAYGAAATLAPSVLQLSSTSIRIPRLVGVVIGLPDGGCLDPDRPLVGPFPLSEGRRHPFIRPSPAAAFFYLIAARAQGPTRRDHGAGRRDVIGVRISIAGVTRSPRPRSHRSWRLTTTTTSLLALLVLRDRHAGGGHHCSCPSS